MYTSKLKQILFVEPELDGPAAGELLVQLPHQRARDGRLRRPRTTVHRSKGTGLTKSRS